MKMKREIGSEFWDIPLLNIENDFFPKETVWLLSGRTALELIVIDSGIKSVSMPTWCCKSMVDPFVKHGVKVSFYENEPNKNFDAIFVIDYFGFTDQIEVPRNYKGVVIRDVTHSLFSKYYDDADYYFGSLRKWAGFITGGFAWGAWKKKLLLQQCDTKYVSLRKKAMKQKASFIRGETNNKEYLSVFKEANDYLLLCEICSAFGDDIYAAKHLDIERMRMIRRTNAAVLIKRVGCLFEMKENDCPLFVPIKTAKRDQLRKYLIDNNVFPPVHWPGSDLGGNELSLVCDQRYDENDMNYICDLIENFYENEGE